MSDEHTTPGVLWEGAVEMVLADWDQDAYPPGTQVLVVPADRAALTRQRILEAIEDNVTGDSDEQRAAAADAIAALVVPSTEVDPAVKYDAAMATIDRLTTELAVAKVAVPMPHAYGVVLFHNRPDGTITLGVPGAEDLAFDIGEGFAIYRDGEGPLSEAEAHRVINERDELATEVEALRSVVRMLLPPDERSEYRYELDGERWLRIDTVSNAWEVWREVTPAERVAIQGATGDE